MNIQFLILIFLYICTSTIEADTCLSEAEKKDVIIRINDLKELYGNVPNYIQCNKKKNYLERFVCDNKNYLQMFHLLSMLNVYALENATKQEYNHKTWNNTHMPYWIKNYTTSKINSTKLCFDIKKETIALNGDYLSPYTNIELFNKIFILQKTSNNIILINKNGYKIYLDKNCKVCDTNKKHGYWYRKDTQFHLTLHHEKSFFDSDDSSLKKYKCVKADSQEFK